MAASKTEKTGPKTLGSDEADEKAGNTAFPDRHLLDLLVCPVSLGPLRYDRDGQELISERASLAFPIRDGIPIMLEDEARVIEE